MIAILPLAGANAFGGGAPTAAQIDIPHMNLPGPTVERKAQQRPLRPPLAGIDCTFGVACPIIWSPPKQEKAIETSAK